jgi:hypothetical protein
MARGPRANFDQEVGQSVKSPIPRSNPRANPPKRNVAQAEAADEAADRKAGIAEGSPRDLALDKQRGLPPDPRAGGGSPGGTHDAHHIAQAAGIAHAILGKGSAY